jgi:hypothetical protein
VSTARPIARPAAPPAEGGAFVAEIERHAQALRERRTAVAAFLAEQLEAIAAKARFFGATDAAQYIEREQVEEDNVRTQWYDLGRKDGRDLAFDEITTVLKRSAGIP